MCLVSEVVVLVPEHAKRQLRKNLNTIHYVTSCSWLGQGCTMIIFAKNLSTCLSISVLNCVDT
jgi:hypothetical protein